MKPFSEKENQSLQKYKKLDQNIETKVGRWNHFRIRFWSYLKVKSNCFEDSNVIFFTFLVNFWGTKLKPFSGKANQSLQNGFILTFARGSILENWFWSYLEVKNECCKCLKMDFLIFLNIFQWTSWKCFWGKQGKAYKTV